MMPATYRLPRVSLFARRSSKTSRGDSFDAQEDPVKQASSQPLFAEGGIEALRGSEACPASRGVEAEGPDSDLGHLVPCCLAWAWD